MILSRVQLVVIVLQMNLRYKLCRTPTLIQKSYPIRNASGPPLCSYVPSYYCNLPGSRPSLSLIHSATPNYPLGFAECYYPVPRRYCHLTLLQCDISLLNPLSPSAIYLLNTYASWRVWSTQPFVIFSQVGKNSIHRKRVSPL